MKHVFQVSVLALATGLCARADATLPGVLTEHMVLQRGLPVHVWGKAAPGEAVSVAFRGETVQTKAGELGRWSVYLAPGEGGGPFELTVKAANTIAFKDVLVGDVWVASGQSNMEFKLRQADNAAAEIAAAKYPKIRRILIARKVADSPQDDAVAQPWVAMEPETAPGSSAVAYFFARHLQEKEGGVPIGIIESFWGGTPVEAWMSLRAMGEDPALMPIFAGWARSLDAWPAVEGQYQKRLESWNEAVSRNKAGGAQTPPKPGRPETGPGGAYTPAGLYNAMIAPLTPYPIRGAIWYQGESNANPNPNGAALYARAFQAMIRDWRRAWGAGDFPFLFVQLANYKANPSWPELREAQRETLSLANTGMAVTIDIGNPGNIHPTNKQDVGLRLALAARAIAYGEKLEYSGPMFRQALREGPEMRVWFGHTGGGLVAKGGSLKGFEIAGADRKFVPAEARIDGGSVVVTAVGVAAPAYVRYAWADNPDCNLYNAEGLPASPFRSPE
ncbi:MAG: sialate O-acetylesterase [Acidobacteriota bacterium]